MIFDILNLVCGLGGVEQTWDALQYFRDKTAEAGFPGLELHLTVHSDRHMEKPIDEKSNRLYLNSSTTQVLTG